MSPFITRNFTSEGRIIGKLNTTGDRQSGKEQMSKLLMNYLEPFLPTYDHFGSNAVSGGALGLIARAGIEPTSGTKWKPPHGEGIYGAARWCRESDEGVEPNRWAQTFFKLDDRRQYLEEAKGELLLNQQAELLLIKEALPLIGQVCQDMYRENVRRSK